MSTNDLEVALEGVAGRRWKVFLPLILVVLLAWSALWIVSPNIDPYKQIPATCMLALFAFNITASSSLPNVPYLTFLDAFVLACYVFVFLIVPKNTVSQYLHSEGLTEKARIRHQDFRPAVESMTESGFELWTSPSIRSPIR